MENKISAIVLTKNEEEDIEKCLRSLSWCDEIVIIDDFSDDNSLKIINNIKKTKEFKNSSIKIFQRYLRGSFTEQRNFGLLKAKYKWVLFIDADEEVSENLKKEITSQLETDESKKVNGYLIKRKDYFLGKWLNYGETGNIQFIRLAKKESGKWWGSVHEKWEIDGNVSNLHNPILHYPHKNISEFLVKINSYSDLVAQHWKEQGRKSNLVQLTVYPLFKFINNYLLKLGFLDGVPGFAMAAMMSFHSFLVRSKVNISQNRE